MAKETAFATVDPLPVKATLATVLPTVNVVTSTSPDKVAVPPTSLRVRVVTPLIAPLALMSVFATLSPVDNVRVALSPVTAPMVISPVPSVALVLIVILLSWPSVTAPNTIASFELLIDVFNVTVPATLLVVKPPLKVKLSPVELPKINVPSFWKVTTLVKVLVPPLNLIFATVLPTVKSVVDTLLLKVAVPPTSLKVRVVTPLIFPDAVMSDPVTLSSVVNVKVLEPPVMAAIVMSALLVVVELVSRVVALPSVTALRQWHHLNLQQYRLG